jgi:hypothetical protein
MSHFRGWDQLLTMETQFINVINSIENLTHLSIEEEIVCLFCVSVCFVCHVEIPKTTMLSPSLFGTLEKVSMSKGVVRWFGHIWLTIRNKRY